MNAHQASDLVVIASLPFRINKYWSADAFPRQRQAWEFTQYVLAILAMNRQTEVIERD